MSEQAQATGARGDEAGGLHEARIRRLQRELEERGWEAYVAVDTRNIRYLSGFTGTAARMVITPDSSTFITDFRYQEQSKDQVRGSRVQIASGSYDEAVVQALRDTGSTKVALPGPLVTLEQRDRLARQAEECELCTAPDLTARLRRIKDASEIAVIERAVAVAAEVFDSILPEIRPGAEEKDIALEIEFRMRRSGASAASFDSIVASGWRSSLPHGIASSKEIAKGDLVTIDMGAVVDGYCSDMTRTVSVGEPNDDARKIYEVVLGSQVRCAEQVRPGMSGREADALARDVIEEEGYGRYFGHGTGHGIGLEVHEAPRLSPKAEDSDVLDPGVVFTVEPGIYIPGMGGVRIEDIVAMEESGPRILTPNPKELLVL